MNVEQEVCTVAPVFPMKDLNRIVCGILGWNIDTKRIEYDNGTLYIVLEHCDMNLTEFMKEKLRKEQRRLTEEEVRIIMK